MIIIATAIVENRPMASTMFDFSSEEGVLESVLVWLV